MSERIFTLASLSEMARRTTETPPRVSVYDVIAAAKGCDGNVAGEVFRRMLHSGTVPTCEEVPQSLIQANCLNQTSRGGARKPVVVGMISGKIMSLTGLSKQLDSGKLPESSLKGAANLIFDFIGDSVR